MFDIKEYFENEYKTRDLRHDIVNIDEDITRDINSLLSTRFDSLYRRDRYKHDGTVIEIIHPALQFPGSNSLILNPDRVRYLLSFYPSKEDFANIDKIVLRPRFIEVGSIELVSLYLRRKRILVLYLFHPHFYRMKYRGRVEDADDSDRDDVLVHDRLTDDTVRPEAGSDVYVHPLWYLLSIVKRADDDMIDKFFIKKDALNDRMYEVLNDTSLYYSRHGY
jgi:hypothetical protein